MPSQNELVRVKDPKSGREFTTGRQHAKNTGLTILEGRPARDARNGRAAAPKASTNLAGQTRADLEKVAREAGLDDATISGASTKADLATAIQSHTGGSQ